MKILYTIAGEGLGHATRSESVIEHLKKKHSIVIATDSRGFDYFYHPKNKMYRISTPHIAYRHNTMSLGLSLFINFLSLPKQILSFFTLGSIFLRHKPDLVINDFTYQVSYLRWLFGVPMIAIDNQHILTKTQVDLLEGKRLDCLKTFIAVLLGVPHANHYFITSFFYPKTKKKNATVVGPILREKVKNLSVKEGDYFLVYQTSQSNDELLRMLPLLDARFIVYGFGKKKSKGSVVFKEHNEDAFFKDLAQCKGVIANGGFSLLSEAIYLGKPVLSQPVDKQFEQMLNAHYLDKLGYGMQVTEINPENFSLFTRRLLQFKKNLKKFDKKRVNDVFGYLDRLLKKLAS